MRLVNFSVTNYRSITSANRLPLADATVLLGQNNEGKSNLLSALNAAMAVVTQLGEQRLVQGRLRLRRSPDFYQWERDFPISMQEGHPDGESAFRLEFRLDDDERSEFRAEVKSTLNDTLPIEIRIGSRDPHFRVIKKGPGAAALNKKTSEIAAFIGRRVEFTYIPAVRTANEALEVARTMVERELRLLERDEKYVDLVNNLAKAQQPILQAISKRIGSALKEFLPQIKSVDVRVSDDSRYRALRRSVDIVVDDGTPTSLERKGDGVQSLAAISLLRGVTASERDIILALEEPESHLHPSAIHTLRDVIEELSHKHQVVLTSHCPLFVDRVRIHSNIIVSGNTAHPAKSIAEIREVLGVRAADNLRHASWVLVVEGDTDARALKAILGHESPAIRAALRNGQLAFENLGGSGKLTYKLNELRTALCGVHVFLDNDDAGRLASEIAEKEGLLKSLDRHFATCKGKANSEWEDLIDSALYAQSIRDEHGVELAGAPFQNARIWSQRMYETFHGAGKTWNERTKLEVKGRIADLIEGNPDRALNDHTRSAVDHLKVELERKLAPKGA